MDLSYTYEKFYEAVSCFISESKLLQDRLAITFGSLNTLRDDDLPDEDRLRERFSYLIPKLDVLAIPWEKPLSIDEIEDLSKAKEEKDKLAQEILAIFASLARRFPPPSQQKIS